MNQSIYVGLAAQRALLQRLETIASNVANQSTPGYRAEDISFASIVSPSAAPATAFASRGQTHISTRSGGITPTGNPLDLAVGGDAWFQISTAGGPALTRDGRFHMTANGALVTVTGNAVLDAGGAPIVLDPNSGSPAIARDGRILQDNRPTGVIGLFVIPPGTRLSRGEDGSVIADRDPVPQLDFERAWVQQGYIESSNIEPVTEIARLIALQRTFDAMTSSIGDAENSQTEAIRTLGGS